MHCIPSDGQRKRKGVYARSFWRCGTTLSFFIILNQGSMADKSFFCPKIPWGWQSRSVQITVSPNIDQSGAVVVFTSAFSSEV